MAVTLELDADTGDLALRGSSLNVLSGAQATRQNVLKSFEVVRGQFGLNTLAGFPVSQVLTSAALLDADPESGGVGQTTSIVRDHLRSSDGATGIAGVAQTIGAPLVEIDESLPGLRISASLLDETSVQLTVQQGLAITSGEIA